MVAWGVPYVAIVGAALMSSSTHHTVASPPAPSHVREETPPALLPPPFFYDFKGLRATNARSEEILKTGRQEWYEHQVQKLNTHALAEESLRYANEVLARCTTALDTARARPHRQTIVTIGVLQPIQTLGWRYAEYRGPDEVEHSVWDHSMCVAIHQTKLHHRLPIERKAEA